MRAASFVLELMYDHARANQKDTDRIREKCSQRERKNRLSAKSLVQPATPIKKTRESKKAPKTANRQIHHRTQPSFT